MTSSEFSNNSSFVKARVNISLNNSLIQNALSFSDFLIITNFEQCYLNNLIIFNFYPSMLYLKNTSLLLSNSQFNNKYLSNQLPSNLPVIMSDSTPLFFIINNTIFNYLSIKGNGAVNIFISN